MEQKKTNLIEAAAEFISRHTPPQFKDVNDLREEEDDEVTKKVMAKHGSGLAHVASEGNHHIYALGAKHALKYIHHDSSTGKTIKLGTHGRRATESNYTDMRSKLEDHGHTISDKTDDKIRDFHDSNM